MKTNQLMAAMIERCRDTIAEFAGGNIDLPKSLKRSHLLWMCDQMAAHSKEWPVEKLHRWLGFVQAGTIANRIINLDGAKTMFDQAKIAFGAPSEDLIDHLNLDHPFEFELGGQG